MGLFDRALKDAINKGVQSAVSKAVEGAVRPAADKLAQQTAHAVTDKASEHIGEIKASVNEANAAMAEANEAAKDVTPEQWNQAFSYLEGMANDAAKKMKLCPICGEMVKGEMQFCPHCGAKLPDKTLAELALCPNCGKQNPPGSDFCSECGAKLPGKQLAEEAEAEKDRAVLARWSERLPQFPVWSCGGSHFDLAELEEGRFCFSAWFSGNSAAAQRSVRLYREALKEQGFRQAGRYPSEEHLYKMVDGVCCHADTEHCFEGDADAPSLYFARGDEPSGGFDYVKPEAPKKKAGGLLGSLFG